MIMNHWEEVKSVNVSIEKNEFIWALLISILKNKTILSYKTCLSINVADISKFIVILSLYIANVAFDPQQTRWSPHLLWALDSVLRASIHI